VHSQRAALLLALCRREKQNLMQTRDNAIQELLDAPQIDTAALSLNLRDIRRINALLGWTTFATRFVAAQVRAKHLSSFSLLDVASGSADIPLAIARWAQRAGISAQIVASDLNPDIVAIAQKQGTGMPGFRAEVHDALALPYAPGTFDIALCTLALHHFAPEFATNILRQMARVARHVIVFDVARSWPAYLGAVALTRMARMHPMTRHDAPASVRRAYTAPELRSIAHNAGLRDARVWASFPFRLALSASGDEAEEGGTAP
jgi:2-polyprenyl-3-methyl-5-hydroxy-6-metoxy-1,4-benzoquinol methylase